MRRLFWHAYLANTSLVIANSLLFRYADFVTHLGGTEFHLGMIVGVGMIGSLLMRVFQGTGIDQLGARTIWLWSLLIYVVSAILHLSISNIQGPEVYLVRMLYATSLAGAFGASLTAISRHVPVEKIATVIGTLGTSGFVGMMIGPRLGDFICRNGQVGAAEIQRLFLSAAGLGTLALLLVVTAPRIGQVPIRKRRPPAWWVMRRYHPGPVLIAGIMMGIGLGLPMVFLRTFVASLGISDIGTFFSVYAPSAFVVRILMRGLPERTGNPPLIVLGFAIMVAGILAFLAVGQSWHLAFPAVLLGASHALLFPTVTAEGSGRFPARYRGLGTIIILGMFDVGGLVGSPLVGTVLRFARMGGLPAYPTMFVSIAAIISIATIIYGVLARRERQFQFSNLNNRGNFAQSNRQVRQNAAALDEVETGTESSKPYRQTAKCG